MRVRLLRFIAVGLIAGATAIIVGCASNPSAVLAANHRATREKIAALPGKPGCFWLSNFYGGWTVLNDRELIVYAPYSQPYLIKLFAPVPTLGFAQRLGFLDMARTGMICNRSQDDLVVPSGYPHRIPILAVHKLTVPQEQALLAENHLK